MGLQPKITLTQEQLAGIELHTADLITACDSALSRLQSIPKANRPTMIVNEINHWQKTKSALAWSLGIARQRRITSRVAYDGTMGDDKERTG